MITRQPVEYVLDLLMDRDKPVLLRILDPLPRTVSKHASQHPTYKGHIQHMLICFLSIFSKIEENVRRLFCPWGSLGLPQLITS